MWLESVMLLGIKIYRARWDRGAENASAESSPRGQLTMPKMPGLIMLPGDWAPQVAAKTNHEKILKLFCFLFPTVLKAVQWYKQKNLGDSYKVISFRLPVWKLPSLTASLACGWPRRCCRCRDRHGGQLRHSHLGQPLRTERADGLPPQACTGVESCSLRWQIKDS